MFPCPSPTQGPATEPSLDVTLVPMWAPGYFGTPTHTRVEGTQMFPQGGVGVRRERVSWQRGPAMPLCPCPGQTTYQLCWSTGPGSLLGCLLSTAPGSHCPTNKFQFILHGKLRLVFPPHLMPASFSTQHRVL